MWVILQCSQKHTNADLLRTDFDAQMWGLCIMLTQTCFQWSRQLTASQEKKFTKQNHACLIRFLSWSEQTSLPEVLFHCWLVEHSLPFPAIFTGLISLLTWLKDAYMCSASKSDKNIIVASIKQISSSIGETLVAFCSLHLCSQIRAAETGVPRLCSTCHAWFSFTAFVRVSVLHNISTVHCISAPTTINHSQVLMHQINTMLLSFIANNGWHSKNCTELPTECSLPHVLLVQYFACPLLLQSESIHHQNHW